jgi:hypothetical protein
MPAAEHRRADRGRPVEIYVDFERFDEFEHKLFDAGGQADGELAQEYRRAARTSRETRRASFRPRRST